MTDILSKEQIAEIRHDLAIATQTPEDILFPSEKEKAMHILCADCEYCGDKYSFPKPNDLIDVDKDNPFIKHYYCCCGDSPHYKEDVTGLGIEQCDDFDAL